MHNLDEESKALSAAVATALPKFNSDVKKDECATFSDSEMKTNNGTDDHLTNSINPLGEQACHQLLYE